MDQSSSIKIKEMGSHFEQKDDYITNTITLLRKWAEVNATEDTLVKERKEFKKNMLLLEKRHNEFIEKEKLFEDSTKRYEKFLQENSVKLAHAAKKKEEEENCQARHTTLINSLKEEIQLLQQKEHKLNQQIQNYQVFQEFVRKVVDSSGEFSTVNDVVNRFEILMIVLKELSEQGRLFNEEIEAERTQMMQYIDDKNNEILEYNNQIAKLQRHVDHALTEALKCESRWNHLKNAMSTKCLERGQIKMAVHNLFNIIIKHQKLDFHTEDTMQQLEKIQEFIVDWKEVVEEMKSTRLSVESIS
ncbi:coiled-coil domain-containing protein 42 homolog [Centruroides vittatus]|uniref:coiled-coil domain-containing protein 42 homolog n=1 Tax=Centruroides vittatus TaxID=120091 RepID=UPI00350FE5A9